MFTHYRETTDWGDLPIPNSEYWTNEQGHLVAHRPVGGSIRVFAKPMKRFSRSRRRFQKLDSVEELPND